jgi:glycine C-acetyltransferase
MNAQFLEHVASSNQSMRDAGTFKRERVIDSAQGTMVKLADGKEYLNLCQREIYLRYSDDPQAARRPVEPIPRL